MIQNLNIHTEEHDYVYLVETLEAEPSRVLIDGKTHSLYIGDRCLKKHDNGWSLAVTEYDAKLEACPTQTIRIWFPRHSVDTYRNKKKYIVSVDTMIHGLSTSLGMFVIDRNEALAGFKKVASKEYYEYADIVIPDAHFIIYSDEFDQFRKDYWNEPLEYNGDVTNVTVALCPVSFIDDHYERDGIDFNGAPIELSDIDEDLSVKLSTNVNTPMHTPYFKAELKYNKEYEDSFEGLTQYINETYLIDEFHLLWELYVEDVDGEQVKYVNKPIEDSMTDEVTFDINEVHFDGWDEYEDGMTVRAVCYIVYPEGIRTLDSNVINLSPDIFKYFIDNEGWQYNIPLSQVNMINYNLNIVNKVVKEVINVDQPDDYKANIIKPVFFKTQDGISINIHKEVSENICLPLNIYKSQVDCFYIKVEEAIFSEIGRVPEGVIFKIDAGKLTKSTDTGKYYIMNQDYELVTSGEYKYV